MANMIRMVTVLDDVRESRRQVAVAAYHAMVTKDMTRLPSLMHELEEWAAVTSPRVLNATIASIGLWRRKAELAQLDAVLTKLLEAKADSDELARLDQMYDTLLPDRPAFAPASQSSLLNLATGTMSRRRPPRPAFPDVVTYNTLLAVVLRMIARHMYTPRIRSRSRDEVMTQLAAGQAELADSAAASEYSAVSEKLRQLNFDTDIGPITLENISSLFESILRHMKTESQLEPDCFTYNIMVSMYCKLRRPHEVFKIFQTMRQKGLVGIESIDNLLWKWVLWLPESERQSLAAVDDVMEVYGVLRANLVQREMDKSYPKASTRSEGDDEDNKTDLPRADEPTLRQIIDLDNLPVEFVPTHITYALMIRVLTRAGRLSDALGVFKDLVSTPEPGSAECFQPTLEIYASFFKAYAMHGKPSQIVHYDDQQPEQSQWAANNEARTGENEDTNNTQAAMWNMDTFREIFANFLQFTPVLHYLPQQPADGLTGATLDQAVRTDNFDLSRLPLESKHLNRAPSPSTLFWILTSLRRVSGNHARWTLAMWQKVEDKFSNARSDDGSQWYKYSLDPRLHRIINSLRKEAENADM